ncbi:hypothetical protein GCM10007086_32600 [Photobacterium aphoticum]|nr:hypothetical protein GCM10007086_32600 [Photobacterium aphoticum]
MTNGILIDLTTTALTLSLIRYTISQGAPSFVVAFACFINSVCVIGSMTIPRIDDQSPSAAIWPYIVQLMLGKLDDSRYNVMLYTQVALKCPLRDEVGCLSGKGLFTAV